MADDGQGEDEIGAQRLPRRPGLGFPVHALVGSAPLGIFAVASLFDLGSHVAKQVAFARPAFWAVVVGLGVGVLAGIPGLIDVRRLSAGSPARATAIRHTVVTDAALALYAVSALLRRDTDPAAPVAWFPAGLAAVALVVLVVGLGYGARLTYAHGVGVEAASGPGGPAGPGQNNG